jgi:hypothetical protein
MRTAPAAAPALPQQPVPPLSPQFACGCQACLRPISRRARST